MKKIHYDGNSTSKKKVKKTYCGIVSKNFTINYDKVTCKRCLAKLDKIPF